MLYHHILYQYSRLQWNKNRKIERFHTHFFIIIPILLSSLLLLLSNTILSFQNSMTKSHTKNPLHSTSNYPPQFRWPVNESFISNFRGGKLSCAVKFPARSTLRSKAPAEKPVIMKSFDVDLSDGIVRREVYACEERKKWLNYSALACATFQIGTMFRRIPHVITRPTYTFAWDICQWDRQRVSILTFQWRIFRIFNLFTRKGGSDWGLFIYRACVTSYKRTVSHALRKVTRRIFGRIFDPC